jgi:hypothetical protein
MGISEPEVSCLKHILSVGAALAALAFTTSIGFAQTTGTMQNITPGSSGTKVVAPKSTHKKAKHNIPNTGTPGSNGFSGSGQLPVHPKKNKLSSSGPTLNTLQMNRKSTDHNNPNSVVPGSDSYSGSAPKPAGT